MMETLIRLLIALLMAWLTPTSSTGSGQPPEMGAQPARVRHVIESVDARLLESYPVQIMLEVRGYQPDGCMMPVQIEQTRSGNSVNVDIFRELPPDALCTMVIMEYTETIPLEGGFESGAYSITVNGVTIDVTI
jgi:hypothetical protein